MFYPFLCMDGSTKDLDAVPEKGSAAEKLNITSSSKKPSAQEAHALTVRLFFELLQSPLYLTLITADTFTKYRIHFDIDPPKRCHLVISQVGNTGNILIDSALERPKPRAHGQNGSFTMVQPFADMALERTPPNTLSFASTSMQHL